jgi:hypothetical protein
MVRLIDADTFEEEARNSLDMQDLYLPIHIKDFVIDDMQTVDAIPIEFIEKRIAELKKLNEYEFIANGGYTSPSDYEQWELERLIRDWREQNDKAN